MQHADRRRGASHAPRAPRPCGACAWFRRSTSDSERLPFLTLIFFVPSGQPLLSPLHERRIRSPLLDRRHLERRELRPALRGGPVGEADPALQPRVASVLAGAVLVDLVAGLVLGAGADRRVGVVAVERDRDAVAVLVEVRWRRQAGAGVVLISTVTVYRRLVRDGEIGAAVAVEVGGGDARSRRSDRWERRARVGHEPACRDRSEHAHGLGAVVGGGEVRQAIPVEVAGRESRADRRRRSPAASRANAPLPWPSQHAHGVRSRTMAVGEIGLAVAVEVAPPRATRRIQRRRAAALRVTVKPVFPALRNRIETVPQVSLADAMSSLPSTIEVGGRRDRALWPPVVIVRALLREPGAARSPEDVDCVADAAAPGDVGLPSPLKSPATTDWIPGSAYGRRLLREPAPGFRSNSVCGPVPGLT